MRRRQRMRQSRGERQSALLHRLDLLSHHEHFSLQSFPWNHNTEVSMKAGGQGSYQGEVNDFISRQNVKWRRFSITPGGLAAQNILCKIMHLLKSL